MAIWLPPEELGGHNIVAEFLHQAGLPLDRCHGFAQHVRKVERSFGLPDADAPDAGELLRKAVLDSLQPIPVPTLKRALRGPAGPRICEVALNVVLKGDFRVSILALVRHWNVCSSTPAAARFAGQPISHFFASLKTSGPWKSSVHGRKVVSLGQAA